jgi:hypothetical protein
MDGGEAEQLASVSQGAIGRALRLLPSGGGQGSLQKQREAGKQLLVAATADSPAARLAAANALPPAGARGEFTATLESLSLWLRDLLAVAAGAPDQVAYTTEPKLLAGIVQRRSVKPDAVARAILHVQQARELAGGNVNPQLITADLLRGIRRELVGTA